MKQITTELLEDTEIFSELSESHLQIIAPLLNHQTFESGDIIFAQGMPRHSLFVIISGEIDLLDNEEGEDNVFVTCHKGQVLCERALVEDMRDLSALTGRAATAGQMAVLTSETIEMLKDNHPRLFASMVVGMAHVLGRRLRNASRGPRGRGAAFRTSKTRLEHDLLGERQIPHDVLWGVQTLRAIENFDISGTRIDQYPMWIEALAAIKQACAVANCQLGQLDQERTDAIIAACEEIRKGWWHGHFVVDVIQGGAGTSTNMNANEVIANRALELLQRKRGDYAYLHPNTHVNMSQSTNDVYPSSIKVTLLMMLQGFLEEVQLLNEAFMAKSKEFMHIIKMGRTQLQDAVPMSLGQEFRAWGVQIKEGGRRIELARDTLYHLNLGGTAIGTGINTDPRYAPLVISILSELTGFQLELSEDLVEETQDTSGFVELAGVFKMFAIRLSKICNDLRLLSSGPRCGFNEINLPPAQPGSSIMPGKVNPVIPEVVNQVAFLIIGLDTAVALAAEAGQLELNVFEPLIAHSLYSSLQMMRNAMKTLRERCIVGITANEEHIANMVDRSIGIVTALNPYLGYEKTSIIAKEALKTGRPVRELVIEKGFLTKEQVNRLLSPEAMIMPSKMVLPQE